MKRIMIGVVIVLLSGCSAEEGLNGIGAFSRGYAEGSGYEAAPMEGIEQGSITVNTPGQCQRQGSWTRVGNQVWENMVPPVNTSLPAGIRDYAGEWR